MAEALYLSAGESLDWTPTLAVTAGDVLQVSDGRAAFAPDAIAAGRKGAVQVTGIATVAKTTTMVMLKGSLVYWDHSANKAHLLQVNDRDFPLGVVQEDAASAATTVKVAINERPRYTVSLGDGFASVPVATAGINQMIVGHSEGCSLMLDATSEAQKMDALSLRGVKGGTPCIVDIMFCVNDNGAAELDISLGIASATHATDADAIAEHMFVHIDGAALTLLLQSKDGSTTVTAITSGTAYVVGTPLLVQFDLRSWADIQVYQNGVNVAPASVFNLAAAVGPMKCLAHVEKSSSTGLGNVTVMRLGIRSFEE